MKRFRRPVRGVPTSVVFPQAVFNVPFYPGQDAGFRARVDDAALRVLRLKERYGLLGRSC